MKIRTKTMQLLLEFVCFLVRAMVGAYPRGAAPEGDAQRLFFANHTSHLDTLVLLASMRLNARARTRPVAARDYWAATPFRRWIAENVLNVVFIDRERHEGVDPLDPLRHALREGASLVIFPEGTRSDCELPAAFKSGLFFLARDFPTVRLTPVYLENLHRIMPKGCLLPVPLINRVHYGESIALGPNEERTMFLERAHAAVCSLSPGH